MTLDESLSFERPLPNVEVVADDAALRAMVERLRSASRIALDCESNGMHAYEPRLCAMQLCAANEGEADSSPIVYVVDTLAIGREGLQRLSVLLGPPGPEVIVHDAAFDARLLARMGLRLRGVLDTAVHARLLGLSNTGLQHLVSTFLGVSLSKELQVIDWSQRPFTTEQIQYLADDVRYLGAIATELQRLASQAEIHEEIAVECDYLLQSASEAGEHMRVAVAEHAYLRLRGTHDLPPLGRVILREMAAFRERLALKLDQPAGRVFPTNLLMQLAKTRPADIEQLIKHIGSEFASIARDLWSAIERAFALGDIPREEQVILERPRMESRLLRQFKHRHEALTEWRRVESEQRKVVPHVVLPRHVLDRLVRTGAKTHDELAAMPGFGSVRVRRYADTLLTLLKNADQMADP